jgi:dephospho-CoA kinase
MRSKPIIGLTGSVGAGKSTVARILESFGAAVIDSDRLTHEELRDPAAIAELRRWWGNSICTPDGQVDRREVAGIVFENPAELRRLEALLYPRLAVRRNELRELRLADPTVCAVVLEAPKLYEAGVDRECDAVIVVDADWAIRVSRVAQERGWTKEQLRGRENLQNPIDKKKEIADYVVINDSSIEELRSQVERVFSSVLASFTHGA